MSEEGDQEKKTSKKLLTDAKFVYNVAVQKLKPDRNVDSASSGKEADSLRVILPAFIENEQKHSQLERVRNIQSSPVKMMRRFSQDSAYHEKQSNVSFVQTFFPNPARNQLEIDLQSMLEVIFKLPQKGFRGHKYVQNKPTKDEITSKKSSIVQNENSDNVFDRSPRTLTPEGKSVEEKKAKP